MLKTRSILFAAALLLFCTETLQAQQLSFVSYAADGYDLQGELSGEQKTTRELRLSKASLPANVNDSKMRELSPELDKGYAVLQFGLFFGKRVQDQNENMLVSPSLQLSGGYRFWHWLQAGLGTGVEKYGRVQIHPVFAEVRGTIWDRFFSPYYVFKMGGAFAEVQNDFRYQNARGGLMAEGQAGVAFRFGHMNLLVGTGYHLQQVKLEGTFAGWTGENQRLQHRNFRRLVTATSFRFTF